MPPIMSSFNGYLPWLKKKKLTNRNKQNMQSSSLFSSSPRKTINSCKFELSLLSTQAARVVPTGLVGRQSVARPETRQTVIMHQSIPNAPCLPLPPRADPREFAFFFLMDGKFPGARALKLSRDESGRQMPRYTLRIRCGLLRNATIHARSKLPILLY